MIDRNNIIRMAREAGLPIKIFQIERFAALVAAAEREACAEHYLDICRKAIVEERDACACIAERAGFRSNGTPAYEHIAEAIRARGSA